MLELRLAVGELLKQLDSERNLDFSDLFDQTLLRSNSSLYLPILFVQLPRSVLKMPMLLHNLGRSV
jgi:hypothetical protein